MTGILTSKVKIFIELLAVTVVSYFLADACYVLFFSEQAVVLKNTSQVVHSKSAVEKQVNRSVFALIEQRNLLKVKNLPPKPKKHVPPKVTSAEALSISKRGFRLLGTVLAEKPLRSCAIVLYKNKQSLYRNNAIIGGWKIVEVKRREIILQRGGVKERLLIDADNKKAAIKRVNQRVLKRSYVKSQLSDLSTLSQSVQLQPRTVGKTKGLIVSGLRSKSFFYKMGLRRGDLLVKANGRNLSSLSDAASLMVMLDSNSISLDIVRNKKRQTLTYRLVN